jgi:peptidoglycan-associated lipoprotein
MNAFIKLVAPIALLTLAACAKDSTRPAGGDLGTEGSSSSGSTTPYTGPSAGSTGITSGKAGSGQMPTGKVIYFEFDSSEINGEGQAVVDGWAAYLSGNSSAKIRLEGHADERGTREYNVALGERRANAVLQALTSRGVGANQISVSSFGEERPVADGHDEAAWQQNRRVEVMQ